VTATADALLHKTGASFNRGPSKQNYATPPELIAAVEKRFGSIAWDLAAEPENAKAPQFYTEKDDSLAQDWHKHEGLLWLNPPYNCIAPWAEKCSREHRLEAYVALLVPASVGSNWFQNHVLHQALVLFLNPRVSFDGKHPFPKDIMLCVYGGPRCCDSWRWK
jgi:phage N-6-adenine-methyltransferase